MQARHPGLTPSSASLNYALNSWKRSPVRSGGPAHLSTQHHCTPAPGTLDSEGNSCLIDLRMCTVYGVFVVCESECLCVLRHDLQNLKWKAHSLVHGHCLIVCVCGCLRVCLSSESDVGSRTSKMCMIMLCLYNIVMAVFVWIYNKYMTVMPATGCLVCLIVSWGHRFVFRCRWERMFNNWECGG